MKATAIIILLIGNNFVFAQTTLTGRVTESDSITAIPYALVSIEGTTIGTLTDRNGDFTLYNITPDQVVLAVSSMGYQTQKISLSTAYSQKISISIILNEIVTDLPTSVVNSASLTGGINGLKNLPGSAIYVAPKELVKFSYTDINRTLRAIPGVNIQEEDGFGLRPNIGLRGTGSERSSKITLMEDGVLIAPAPYSAPAAYYFPTIGRMQAVEIMKGSSQIQYGPFTTGGAINLISTSIPEHLKARINITAGSFGSRNMHAFVGSTKGPFGFLAETYQYSATGFKDLQGGGNTGFIKTDYLLKLKWKSKEKARINQSIALKLGQSNENSNETYLGLSQNDFEQSPLMRYAASKKDNMLTKQNQITLSYFVALSKKIQITTTAYYTDFGRNWYKLDKVKDSSGTSISIASLLITPEKYADAFRIVNGGTSYNSNALELKANNRNYQSNGIQTLMNYQFKTKAIKQNVQFGARYHRDDVDRFQWIDKYAMQNSQMKLTEIGKAGTESNVITTAEAFSSYVLYHFQYNKIRITPGLRYEDIKLVNKDYEKTDTERTGVKLKEDNNRSKAFIPGVSAHYTFNRLWTSFAGIHKGFAPAGASENSKPENSVNYEFGAKYTHHNRETKLVLFLSDYSNLLGADLAASGGAGSGELLNQGKANVKGIEFQGTYDPISGKNKKIQLPITLVYTLTHAIFQTSFNSEFEGWGPVTKGDEMPYIAKNQMALLINAEHKTFMTTLSVRYNGAMRTIAGRGPLVVSTSTDEAIIIDWAGTFRITQNIDFFATVTNITNKVYIVSRNPAGARPGLPRAVNFGIKFNLI
jgi:Fe(3+) dicitrate transport protein